ncbi:ROK family protein [Nocardia panacis]|uniref:ROK family protein n=1 Tax=Nocardia panacis TaxID=2340916 RepID=A0A3A4KWQ8_9NOCA|nr:ROK family protein [Nocardia panacis]RJO79871.1 ROK family protein [Nocardia panacis]
MSVLTLAIGPEGFTAGRVDEGAIESEAQRVELPAKRVWDQCADLLLKLAAGAEIGAVGIASVGPIDLRAGVIAPTEIREWRAGFDIAGAVNKIFPAATVSLALDGSCLAIAERAVGAAGSAADLLAISVSNRVVAGVVAGGFTVVGRTGNAGHLGHMLVPGFDESCTCGGRGCLEAVAGGAALVRWAGAHGWVGDSVADLVDAALAEDPIAVAAMERAGTALGRVIVSVAALLDLEIAVIGGELARSGPALWKPLNASIATHARLSFLPGLRAVPSNLGADAALRGAGIIAISSLPD